jgi:hypothetical protein
VRYSERIAMSIYLFCALAAAVTVAGFATVVWISRLACTIPRARRMVLAVGLAAFYIAVLILRPLAWPVIDLAVLAGAIGGVLLLQGSLQTPAAVVVFLAVAAVADLLSMAGGLSHVLIERFRSGQSHLLLYVALVAPLRRGTIPIVGISDLFIGGTAATALIRLKLPAFDVMGSMIGGLLCAVAMGLWFGPTPALPFLAAAVGFLVHRHAQRLRSG